MCVPLKRLTAQNPQFESSHPSHTTRLLRLVVAERVQIVRTFLIGLLLPHLQHDMTTFSSFNSEEGYREDRYHSILDISILDEGIIRS
jgi:hypothetical protein